MHTVSSHSLPSRLVLAALVGFALAEPAYCRQTWVGPGNDFMDPDAWDPAGVPTPGSTRFLRANPVSIFVNGNYAGTTWGVPPWSTPNLDTSLSLNALWIEAMDQPNRVTITNGATLTCTGLPGLILGKHIAYSSPIGGGVMYSPYGSVPAALRLVQGSELLVTQRAEIATHRAAVLSVEQGSSATLSNCQIGPATAQFSVDAGSNLNFLDTLAAGVGSVNFTNSGTLTWPASLSFPLFGAWPRPLVQNQAGGVLRFAPGESSFFGMDVVNHGLIIADQPGQVVNFGPGFAWPTLAGAGTIAAANGGTMVLGLGWSAVAQVPTLRADGPLSEVRLGLGMIENATVLTSGGGVVAGQGGGLRDVTNLGVLVARGNPNQGGGLRLSGTVTNQGLMRGAGGAGAAFPYLGGTFYVHTGETVVLQGSGTIDLNGGSINRWPAYAGTVHNLDNTIRGSGEVVGTIVSSGVIAPGTDTATGFLTVGTSLIMQPQSVTRLRLAGSNQFEFDYIYAYSSTMLAGRLEVSSLNGFVPQAGQTFELVSNFGPAQAISGTFSELAATGALAGCRVTASYMPSRVLISVDCSQICGSLDFNNDGIENDPTDIEAFLSVYSGGPCIPSNATCNDIDFNNDGIEQDPLDIESFLSVYSGGPCL